MMRSENARLGVDLSRIEAAAAKIKIVGERYPEYHMRMTGL